MYLKVVEHPGVFEGRLAKLGGFLLELLDGALVNATALVDQVTSGGRLAGIYVADHHKVDVNFFLRHFGVWTKSCMEAWGRVRSIGRRKKW